VPQGVENLLARYAEQIAVLPSAKEKEKKNNTNATVKHSWRADHLLTNIEKQCIFICIAQSAKDVTISSR